MSKHSLRQASWKNKDNTLKTLFIFLFLAPTMICFCIFYLYPIVTVFVTSFSKWDYTNILKPEMYSGKELFTNYKYIIETYPYFWESLRNSVIWAILGVVLQVPLATIVALALSRKLTGWKVVRNVFIIPNVISTAAMGLIFLQLYNPRYGLINQIVQVFNPEFTDSILLLPGINYIAMTCAYIFFTGTTTILILGSITAVPEEIYEAARLDGASGLVCDFMITLPLIKNILKTVSVLAATSGFLLYNEVYFLTKGAAGTRSISYIIRELAIMSPRMQYSRANAVGVIQIVVGMLLIVVVNIVYSFSDNKFIARLRGDHTDD